MPTARMAMRNVREILRLRFDQDRKHREIAVSCNKSPSTIGDVLTRFEASGLTWPLDPPLDDAELESKLYRQAPLTDIRPLPDWEAVHRELRRRDYHVTRALLWTEYRQAHPDGFEYSWFCKEYDQWLAGVEPVMRQVHKFGEKCFVDFSGDTVPIVDPKTGEVQQAQVFIGVMGASNYTYVKACLAQTLPHWIRAHTDMFGYFGACPRVLVPDNLRSGVTRPEFYEPEINPTYHEMAKHFGIAVIPARVRRPRDKAKAENAVLVAERELLAPLRNRVFYSLEDLTEAIDEQLETLNTRPFQKLPGSRRAAFERDDRPAMQNLPARPYDQGMWKKARVHLDYHIELEGHYYSVPYRLVRQLVEVRYTINTVEVYHLGKRVGSHRRSLSRGVPTTLAEHMPSSHRAVKDWTPDRVLEWAGATGPSTQEAVRQLLIRREHPEQGVRSSLGLLSLKKSYGKERLEAACERALNLGQGALHSYKTVKSILERKLDQVPLPRTSTRSAGDHENIRGGAYYAEQGVLC